MALCGVLFLICNTQFFLMKSGYILLAIAFLFFAACKSNAPQGSTDVSSAELWLTNPDKSALFERQSTPLVFGDSSNTSITIQVSDIARYQEIDGFGYTLTGGSAIHLNGMEPSARAALL